MVSVPVSVIPLVVAEWLGPIFTPKTLKGECLKFLVVFFLQSGDGMVHILVLRQYRFKGNKKVISGNLNTVNRKKITQETN